MTEWAGITIGTLVRARHSPHRHLLRVASLHSGNGMRWAICEWNAPEGEVRGQAFVLDAQGGSSVSAPRGRVVARAAVCHGATAPSCAQG
jgi:hypothetical protein